MNSISIWRYSTLKSTKHRVDEQYSHRKTNNELHIACLYNIYSYRCGFFGWLMSLLSEHLPKTYVLSSLFRRLKWTCDSELLALTVSYINRLFPILNYGVWNRRERFLKYNNEGSIFKYGSDLDSSMSGMYQIFNPFFDSGVALFSNVECKKKGFVPFIDKINRGILWNYFDGFEVLVMTVSTDGNVREQAVEMEQVFELYTKISSSNSCKNTYIIANFKCDLMVYLKDFSITQIDNFTYLLTDYLYFPKVEENCVKFNTPVMSPIYSPRPVMIREVDEDETKTEAKTEDHITTTIKEESNEEIVKEKEEPNEEQPHEVVDEKEKEKEPKQEVESTSIFTSIIYNYFTSKTPPKTPPPSSSPSSTNSNSSDKEWSKV